MGHTAANRNSRSTRGNITPQRAPRERIHERVVRRASRSRSLLVFESTDRAFSSPCDCEGFRNLPAAERHSTRESRAARKRIQSPTGPVGTGPSRNRAQPQATAGDVPPLGMRERCPSLSTAPSKPTPGLAKTRPRCGIFSRNREKMQARNSRPPSRRLAGQGPQTSPFGAVASRS